MPDGVAGRLDALDGEIADGDPFAIGEFALHCAWFEPVVAGIDADRLGGGDTGGDLIPCAHEPSYVARDCEFGVW